MPTATLNLTPAYESHWRAAALNPQRIFTDPRIVVWRSIAERENATFDFEPLAGQRMRWHIKRFRAPDRGAARAEARGIELLTWSGIPTVPLVAWGMLADGRSFLISEDLAGYAPADRLTPPESRGRGPDWLPRIASLAAQLHARGLHHRDLYLCHFLVNPQTGDVRLIDPGRVKRLPGWPFTRRWIVKDLAQLHYSARVLSESARQQLFTDYFAAHPRWVDHRLMSAIERKSRWIARHDRSLRSKRPERDVSLPSGI